MRKLQNRLALPLVLVLLVVSCSANQVAYKTVGSVVTAVDLSMNGWGEYVRAERAKATPSPALAANEAKVRAAFEKYQTTIRAAKGALDASTWNGTAPPNDVAAAATALINLVVELKK
jgi:hypothetical protein